MHIHSIPGDKVNRSPWSRSHTRMHRLRSWHSGNCHSRACRSRSCRSRSCRSHSCRSHSCPYPMIIVPNTHDDLMTLYLIPCCFANISAYCVPLPERWLTFHSLAISSTKRTCSSVSGIITTASDGDIVLNKYCFIWTPQCSWIRIRNLSHVAA